MWHTWFHVKIININTETNINTKTHKPWFMPLKLKKIVLFDLISKYKRKG